MSSRHAAVAAAAIVAWPALAWAHGGAHVDGKLFWDVATGAALVLASLLYARGYARSPAPRAPLSLARAASFYAGIVTVVIALLSPLDAASDIRFSAHMGQHELLVLFAAPLMVVGRPELIVRAALPSSSRAALRSFVHRPAVVSAIRVLGNRWFAVLLHGAVVWLWHIPVLFEAALHDETVHAIQHLTFFGTSALFWWAMIRGRYGRLGYGLAVVFVFVTALHKGLLAMLFTLADRTFYPTHAARTEAAGYEALHDQALAGALMWVPAGVVTGALAIGLFAAWLGALERRAEATRPAGRDDT